MFNIGIIGFTGLPVKGGLKLWLDASVLTLSNNTAVSSWTDSSGNGYHATQSTGISQPIFKTNIINGKPIVRYDGTDDFLISPNGAISGISTDATVFSVHSATDRASSLFISCPQVNTNRFQSHCPWSDGVVYFDFGDITTPSGRLSCPWGGTPGVFSITTFLVGGYAMKIRKNRADLASKTVSLTFIPGVQTLQIGADLGGTNSLLGDIAEFILYNRRLSDAEVILVENYLSSKYGI
jgi:hypothetical protein